MNHEPGPWKTMFHHTKENKNRTWTTGIHSAINLQFATVTGGSREHAENTARLIAATPELLAALMKLVAADNCNYMTETMRYEGLFDEARAAIAKATGG